MTPEDYADYREAARAWAKSKKLDTADNLAFARPIESKKVANSLTRYIEKITTELEVILGIGKAALPDAESAEKFWRMVRGGQYATKKVKKANGV